MILLSVVLHWVVPIRPLDDTGVRVADEISLLGDIASYHGELLASFAGRGISAADASGRDQLYRAFSNKKARLRDLSLIAVQDAQSRSALSGLKRNLIQSYFEAQKHLEALPNSEDPQLQADEIRDALRRGRQDIVAVTAALGIRRNELDLSTAAQQVFGPESADVRGP